MNKRILSVSILFLLFGCGGGAAGAGGSAVPTTNASAKTAEPVKTVQWSEVATPEALQKYVLDAAVSQAKEEAPEVDFAKLAEWRKASDTAPDLSGHAVDVLMYTVTADIAAGRLDDAEATIRLARAKAKNRNSAFVGTTSLAVIASKRAAADDAARKVNVAAVFRELPQARLGGASVVFQMLQKPEQLSARAGQAKEQMLSLDTGVTVLAYEQVFPEIVAHRDVFLAAIEVVRKEQAKAGKPKKYAYSTVRPTQFGKVTPVRIAVWDVGTNPKLFAKQLFVNKAEELNGKDDDNNGVIDDRHGIASDPGLPATALLYEPDAKLLAEYKPHLKGTMDLRAGLSTTPDAKKVLALVAKASTPEAQEVLETSLDAVGEWAHGSHVAGLMTAELPSAELAIFRSAWAGEARIYHHRGPTDAELAAERQNMNDVAGFIKTHGIRVVNASLGFGQDYVEAELGYEKDKYKSDTEVRARAKAIMAARRANWRHVFESCPDTLFVVAAGNSNRDVLEYGDTPGDILAPNVLVVGATDEYGNWSTFTNSNPAQVRIFDAGVAVMSYVPSGEKVPLSGTSMAAPNVANAAAKVLSIAPALTPAEVAELLISTGDPIATPFNGHIVNEKNALTAAKSKAATATPAVAAKPAAAPAAK